MKKKYNKETIASKAGVGSDSMHGAIVPPLYLSTNFIQDEIGKEQPYEYTRQANPSRDHLISALAELEGGIGGEILSSGMAAVSLITNILELNSKVLLPHDCYGGTFRLFSSLADKGILEAHFVDQSTKSFKENAISEISPDLIWIESPSNPLLQVVDIEKICKKAKEINAMVAVDNTFLSPSLQNPLKLGSDIVMHSTTKYINGHSDVIGGAVIAKNRQVLEKIKFWSNNLGIAGAPFDSYLTLRGLRTLSIRMKKHEQNALALVEFLSNNSKIKSVFYPGLTTHPSHNLAKRQQNGFGGMLSFELKEGLNGVKNFINRMELLPFAGSLGGFESLVGHPYTQSHGTHTPEQKEEIGISEGLIRISAGLEDTEDLIEAVKKALN
tara:strand:- start:1388 stop:2539 length:1152 start_codon:yes stop_codon:yes gene_type:complete